MKFSDKTADIVIRPHFITGEALFLLLLFLFVLREMAVIPFAPDRLQFMSF
jgi:hypothetical protein